MRPFALAAFRTVAMAAEPENRSGLRTALVFGMLFLVLAAVVVFAYFATFSRPVTTVILIRHAEKVIDPNNADVDLSVGGEARAGSGDEEKEGGKIGIGADPGHFCLRKKRV